MTTCSFALSGSRADAAEPLAQIKEALEEESSGVSLRCACSKCLTRDRSGSWKRSLFRGLAHDLYSLCALFSNYFPAIGIIYAQPSLNIYGILACWHDGRAANPSSAPSPHQKEFWRDRKRMRDRSSPHKSRHEWNATVYLPMIWMCHSRRKDTSGFVLKLGCRYSGRAQSEATGG